MGWSQVTQGGSEGVLVARRETSDERRFYYFVHSYFPNPKREDLKGECLWADYGGKFLAGYREKNLSSYQFHPEKSGPDGLALLQKFVSGIKKDGPS